MARLTDFILPETASAPKAARDRYIWRSVGAGFPLGFLVGAVTGFWDGEYARLIWLACFPFLAFLIWEFVVLMRALDELQFKLHMIALAVAGGFVCCFVTLWAVLEIAFEFPGFAYALTLPMHGVGYYLALFVVSRRYA